MNIEEITNKYVEILTSTIEQMSALNKTIPNEEINTIMFDGVEINIIKYIFNMLVEDIVKIRNSLIEFRITEETIETIEKAIVEQLTLERNK